MNRNAFPDFIRGNVTVPNRGNSLNIDLATLWRSKLTFLVCGVLGLAAGYAYLQSVPTTYEAQARVLVKPQGVKPDAPTDDRVLPEFLPTQAETIRSPVTIARAVDTIRITAPAGKTGEFDPVRHVLKSLHVTPILKANVLTVGYRSTNEDEALNVISAIVRAYETHVSESDEGKANKDLQLVESREQKLRDELTRAEEAYDKLRLESPLISQGNNLPSSSLTELNLLGKQLADLAGERRLLEARLASVLKSDHQQLNLTNQNKQWSKPLDEQPSLDLGDHPESNQFIPTSSSKDVTPIRPHLAPDYSEIGQLSIDHFEPRLIEQVLRYLHPTEARAIEQLDQDLRFARLRLQLLDETQGDRHPQLIAVRGQVDELQALLKKRIEDVVRSWQQQTQVLRATETELTMTYERERNQLKAAEVYLLREKNLVRNLTNLEKMHSTTLTELLDMQAADSAIEGGRNTIDVRILDGPMLLDEMTWPNQPMVLAASTCMGLFAAFVWITFSNLVPEKTERRLILAQENSPAQNRESNSQTELWSSDHASNDSSTTSSSVSSGPLQMELPFSHTASSSVSRIDRN